MTRRLLSLILLLACASTAGAGEIPAPATIVVDAGSGAVLEQQAAGQPRHPASLTKMMTLYLAFQAMATGRADIATRVPVSERAAAQGGSVLGLAAGTSIALGDALTALVVRSANDAAVAVAEFLDGSEDAFARHMSEQAQRLGMTATRFANATGLTAAGHVTTARDMAMLAIALRRDFPAQWPLFSATSMRWRQHQLPTVNGFLASYPGAEGLKTGFTCPAGYNLAAAASRGGRHAIAVILGATAKTQRLSLAAGLLDRAFRTPNGGDLTKISNVAATIPDLTAKVCEGGPVGGAGTIVPRGWALEVALGRDQATVRRLLAQRYRQLNRALGGGTPVVTIKPFSGGLLYRGLIAGLDERKAVPVCLHLRQDDENNCLVLPPPAVEGAVEAEQRWRMLSAR